VVLRPGKAASLGPSRKQAFPRPAGLVVRPTPTGLIRPIERWGWPASLRRRRRSHRAHGLFITRRDGCLFLAMGRPGNPVRGAPLVPNRGYCPSPHLQCRTKCCLVGIILETAVGQGGVWRCGAWHDGAEWSFHSKERQRRPAPSESFNLPRSGLTKRVKRCIVKNALAAIELDHVSNGQLPFQGS
jgi:hypothetical protein